MKVALLVGAFAVGAIAGIDYPTSSYIITTYGGDKHAEEIVDFDRVTVTRYIAWGDLMVTVSRVQEAKITCFDLTIEPATILQSCRNVP